MIYNFHTVVLLFHLQQDECYNMQNLLLVKFDCLLGRIEQELRLTSILQSDESYLQLHWSKNAKIASLLIP